MMLASLLDTGINCLESGLFQIPGRLQFDNAVLPAGCLVELAQHIEGCLGGLLYLISVLSQS